MTAVIAAYILVGNDLDTLHVPGGFKDLPQDVFGDASIKTSNIQSALVWFGSSPTDKAAGAGRGHHVAGHRRGDRRRNRIGVLGDHDRGKRWWRHMCRICLPVALGPIELLLTRGTCRGLGRGRKGRRSGGLGVLSHCEEEKKKLWAWMDGYISRKRRYRMEKAANSDRKETIIQAGSTRNGMRRYKLDRTRERESRGGGGLRSVCFRDRMKRS